MGRKLSLVAVKWTNGPSAGEVTYIGLTEGHRDDYVDGKTYKLPVYMSNGETREFTVDKSQEPEPKHCAGRLTSWGAEKLHHLLVRKYYEIHTYAGGGAFIAQEHSWTMSHVYCGSARGRFHYVLAQVVSENLEDVNCLKCRPRSKKEQQAAKKQETAAAEPKKVRRAIADVKSATKRLGELLTRSREEICPDYSKYGDSAKYLAKAQAQLDRVQELLNAAKVMVPTEER